MSALRNRLIKRPEFYLAIVALLVTLVAIDAMRPPRNQVSVRMYVSAVHGYHRYIHPLTYRFIRCHYRPTCSRYSVEAVEKYGIFHGLQLSFVRLASCRSGVPFGTYDPVP